jgi:hypothetical protein
MYNDTTKPTLVEPGVKYFLHESLKKCNEYRVRYKNHIYNMVILGTFVLLVAGILLYKYKGRLTPNEKRMKDNDKKQYILSKIKNYQDAKRTAQQELITGLPHWDAENDVLNNDIGKLSKII